VRVSANTTVKAEYRNLLIVDGESNIFSVN